MEKSTQLNINYKDESIRVWLLRDHNTLDNTKYTHLISTLVTLMPEEQLNNIITRYPRPIILLDDILKCFKYYGYDPGAERSYCICGKRIKNVHCIRNLVTRKKYRIGSSCCKQWSLQSHLEYTPTKAYKLLRICFDAIGKDYISMKRVRRKVHPGKYKNETISSVIQKDRPYCYWCYKNYIGCDTFHKELKRQLLNI
jgi:hypothetical protein